MKNKILKFIIKFELKHMHILAYEFYLFINKSIDSSFKRD